MDHSIIVVNILKHKSCGVSGEPSQPPMLNVRERIESC